LVLPELPALVIRKATPADIEAIELLVDAAYRHYVSRIGLRPLPMDDDYPARVGRGEAYVAGEERVKGVVVLVAHDDYLLIDNVAVDPSHQRRGLGRRLMAFAEEQARNLGLAEMRLYTNVKMVENRALYARLGYEEIEEVEIEGRHGILMAKRLARD
jgi:ribosomal protein S18 acetylase RimI-like enzyme